MAKKKYADYLDEEKAAALAKLDLNHGNVNKTAGELGIPRKTLAGWAKGSHVKPVVQEIRQKKRQDLATRFENLVHLSIDRQEQLINTADIHTAKSIADGSVANYQLLNGQPTVRTEQGGPGDYSNRVDELRRKREQRNAG
jgi:hypothetical protein